MANDEVQQTQCAVYADLRSKGCCKRCCLRHMGERDPQSYINIDDVLLKKGLELDKETQNGQRTKMLKSNPCIVCLGLLQNTSKEDTIHQITSYILKASFDCGSFTCALSLPISFQLRAHSLWLYLLDKFPLLYDLPDASQETRVVSIKEVWKWTVAPQLAKVVGKELDSGVMCDFFVGVNVAYSDDANECSCLLQMHAEHFKDRRNQRRKYHGNLYTRKSVDVILQTTEASHFKQFFPSPPAIPSTSIVCDNVTCSHNSIFMAGRYNKFSRMLSQTPWVINGERRMQSSVQEIICKSIQTICQADSAKFSASGREDVDVRTLGRGRPFVCELLNPHRIKFTPEQIRVLEREINAGTKDVAIRDLQIVPKDELQILKQGEEKKTKKYVALCMSGGRPIPRSELETLNGMVDVSLSQKTPIRVLHRRPAACRTRVVHSMRASLPPQEPCDTQVAGSKLPLVQEEETYKTFKLEITTQAGTYVKEFVHGDFGRTKPSLGQLLGNARIDILALDVQEIVLDWPTPVDYSK